MLTIGVSARRALCRLARPLARPGPQCSSVAAGLAGHARVAVGRAGHHALEQAEHAAHAGDAVERGDEVHLRGAGIAEAGIDPAFQQRVHQAFGAVHSRWSPRWPASGHTARALARWQPGRNCWHAAAIQSDQEWTVAMRFTVLYSENMYADDSVERRIYGPDVRVIFPQASASVADLSDADCAAADGLMIMRFRVTAADLRPLSQATRDLPDGRGLRHPGPQGGGRAADHDPATCRITAPPKWPTTRSPWRWRCAAGCCCTTSCSAGIRRRHGAMCAIRWCGAPGCRPSASSASGVSAPRPRCARRRLGFRVVFFDPYLPNGAELGVGVERAASLEALLRQTDTLSIHAPLTPQTRGLIGAPELALLPQGAVVVNTARGPIIDIDALADGIARAGTWPASGSTCVPVEPPVEPVAGTAARLPRTRGVVRGAADHHAALGVSSRRRRGTTSAPSRPRRCARRCSGRGRRT